MRHLIIVAAALAASLSLAHAQEFRIEEVAAVAATDPAQLKARTILFSDHHKDEIADHGHGLIRFEDWARVQPVQKQFLSLYPTYAEPTVNVTRNGTTKPHKVKLHMFVAEARFLVPRPASSIDVARYASLPFLERMDKMIKHRQIAATEAKPLKDPELASNRNPERAWCEAKPHVLCIQSRYDLEGKLPAGIMLANKLKDEGKKIADFMEFQSELRVIPPQELNQPALARLTGLATPVAGALEQNIFYVNQVMQFGKFLAVFQPHPGDASKTIVTAFMTLAVHSDTLEKKKEYENIPVLRNLVPGQVLAGKSSFNTGTSISAGLPEYTRNQAKAVAAILERE
jgi:hypothetical protein